MAHRILYLLPLVALLTACSQDRIQETRAWAAGVRPVVRDMAVLQQQRQYRELAADQVAGQMTETEEKKVAYSERLTYPRNWPEIVEVRERGQ